MYGYTLDKKEGLEEIPVNITMTTERMLEETLKNFPGKTYRKVIEALKAARLIDIYGVENSEVTAVDLSDEAAVSGASVPAFYGLLSAADRRRTPDGSGCGCGHFLFRGIEGYGGRHESGEAFRSMYDRDHEFQGFYDR